jgi:probable F420-dependent oxidoreductase
MTTLNFGMQLPVQAQSKMMLAEWEPSAGPAEVLAIAQAAERAGFYYVSVCDHVAVPRGPHERMSTTWWDTVSTLGWLGGQTTRIHLASTVFVLPYRHPLVTSKSFMTLDYLTGGRAILGIGAGHAEGEFEALGVPFHQRGKITDEAIGVIRHAFQEEWTGDVGQKPRPVQPGGPPIWVGGSSPAAIRRAALLGDGWLPQGPPAEGMEAAIARIHQLRDEAGRKEAFAMGGGASLYVGKPGFDLAPHYTTGTPEQIADHLRSLEAMGITHPQIRFGSSSYAEFVDQIEVFGAQVVPLLGS